jgi:hypothetical protein
MSQYANINFAIKHRFLKLLLSVTQTRKKFHSGRINCSLQMNQILHAGSGLSIVAATASK